MQLAIVIGIFVSVRVISAQTRSGAMRFEATADSVEGITAKGTLTHDGIVAADPAVLPLGSVIQVSGAGPYSGTYVVTDTGSKVAGRKIDIFLPGVGEARQFGKKMVTVRILRRGDNQKDHREVTPANPR
jgi:3D (Asp-Asp-Asp) domain-containing protein